MRNLSKKELSELEIVVTDKGFVIWCKSKTKQGNTVRHWLVDAGCLKEDGEIRLGCKAGKIYTTQVVGDAERITIKRAFKSELIDYTPKKKRK